MVLEASTCTWHIGISWAWIDCIPLWSYWYPSKISSSTTYIVLIIYVEDLKLNIDIHGRYTVIFMARKMSFIFALYFVGGLSLMLCSG